MLVFDRLCADIYNQICRKMVDGLELFEGTSNNFRRHLCMVLHPTAFMPGDYICMQVGVCFTSEAGNSNPVLDVMIRVA